MRSLSVLVVVLALGLSGCGSKPAPAPVQFRIGGMKIGDPLTPEWEAAHCLPTMRGPNATGRETISVGDANVEALYYFVDSKLAAVTLSFDADLYASIVDAYTKKFGRGPDLSPRGGVIWQTTDGRFCVFEHKPGASLFSPAYDAHKEREKAEKTKALSEKL